MWQSLALGNIILGAFVLCEACAKECCWPWHLSMLLLAPVCLLGCALYFGSVWLQGSRSPQCEFILLSAAVSHLRCLPEQMPPELGLHWIAAIAEHQLRWCSECNLPYLSPFFHDVMMSNWSSSVGHMLCMDLCLKIYSQIFYQWLLLRVKRIVLACFTVPFASAKRR